MSTNVTVNGVIYPVPAYGETGWAQGSGNLSQLLIALAAATASSPSFMQYVSVTSTPTTMATGHTYLVSSNSVAATLNVPQPSANTWFIVKDVGNNASSNNITIHRFGSELIDGVASDKVCSLNKGVWILTSDGTNWFSILDNTLLVMTSNAQTIAGIKTFTDVVNVGLSGSAGQIDMFPAGANKGRIRIVATNNSGDTVNQITNVSQTGSRVFTLPDPSTTNSNFVLSEGDATINGKKTFAIQLIGAGTTTNDSAAAGYIGEQVIASVTAYANTAATTQFGNITSISLTAGDWDVTGQVLAYTNGATVTRHQMAVSVNSGNTTTDHVDGSNQMEAPPVVGNGASSPMTVSNYRISIASTTTVYLKAASTFSAGNPQVIGTIRARRRR